MYQTVIHLTYTIMKKSIITYLSVIMLIYAGSIQSQNLSLHAGYSLSKWGNAEFGENMNFRPGFHVGGNYALTLAPKFSFAPGIRYHEKGTRMEFSESYEIAPGQQERLTDQTTAKINYLEFPLQLNYALSDRFSVILEPTVSLTLSDKFEYTSVTCINENCTGEEGSYWLKTEETELGVALGFGYRIFNTIGLIARYQIGQNEITEEGNTQTLFFSAQINF